MAFGGVLLLNILLMVIFGLAAAGIVCLILSGILFIIFYPNDDIVVEIQEGEAIVGEMQKKSNKASRLELSEEQKMEFAKMRELLLRYY